MSETDRIRVRHMLDAAREALSFVEGRTIEDLKSNRMLALSRREQSRCKADRHEHRHRSGRGFRADGRRHEARRGSGPPRVSGREDAE